MGKSEKGNRNLSRRAFLSAIGRGISFLGLGGVAAASVLRSRRQAYVWQINPWKCVHCTRCQTECVLDLSAVKCVNDFPMCGYCDICFGFLQTQPVAIDSGAENQMCPTGAIKRSFVEEPYYQYTIDEKLCSGCAKCVEACLLFGNGSFYLQVRHDRCVNCNECAIAVACPSDAFIRLPVDKPYVIKHEGQESLENV